MISHEKERFREKVAKFTVHRRLFFCRSKTTFPLKRTKSKEDKKAKQNEIILDTISNQQARDRGTTV